MLASDEASPCSQPHHRLVLRTKQERSNLAVMRGTRSSARGTRDSGYLHAWVVARERVVGSWVLLVREGGRMGKGQL